MLRIATTADIPAILSIYAPYILHTTATFEYDVPAEEEFRQRFESVTVQYPWLVWEEGGEILGYAYVSAPYSRAAFAWCAEPSIYLKPEARGQGIGKKLYAALEAILKKQGYHVLYALITAENRESIAFHEALGYKFQAEFPACGWKFDRWLGLIWMEKRLNSVEIPTETPTSWLSIGQKSEISRDILDILSLS